MEDDIAVIGVAVRFPGDATSPEKLWQVLENGESQWSEIPKDRLNIDGFFHPSGDRQGSISFRGAHFLKEDVAAFDAPFFSIAAEDAKAIDPQQRMLLEVSYEALENAGIRKEDVAGSDTAVYVGSFVKDYEQICLRDPDWQPQYAATGNGIAIMANRISYFFDLHGPSVTVDTGCSGSLVSVHWGAQSIRSGESSMAIVAGAGMILTPHTIMPMTALNFLSPDGRCFTFDSRANGYGRGEGIGVVILKRMSDAIRDNDPIRAVIRGSKVNQDGRTTGITLPSKEAQVANIRAVYKNAGLAFDQTAYVECHGTGTQAGDWRELKAISETLGSVRPVDRPIVVGSVKPNIGHLEGAAGVAGLIKGVLILEHGRIPPNINFKEGNPTIDFEDWRVKVPRKMLDWPLPGVKRISVNCFGFGGTNAHVIMDEAPAQKRLQYQQDSTSSSVPQLFVYSSSERQGIQRIIESHSPYLESKDTGDHQFVDDYAYTLACRRSLFEWRHAFVAESLEDLRSQIKDTDPSTFIRTAKDKMPRICFVFCGQGAQWAKMGQDLMAFDVFRKSMEEASQYIRDSLKSPFDIIEEIMLPEEDSRVEHPAIAQPATTALQVALIELLRSFGIAPRQVIGHSSGEIAAGFACGAISRQEAWEVAFYRGLAAASIPIRSNKIKGGMMVVGMSLQDTERYLKTCEHPNVQVACINSPRSITISGDKDSIDKIGDDLRHQKIFCRTLKVQTAYHSDHMKVAALDYQQSLDSIVPSQKDSNVQMFSTVTGQLGKNSDLTSAYWTKNLVSPVQFVKAIETMMKLPEDDRPNTIIELSPSGALKSPVSDILSSLGLANSPAYHAVLDRRNNGVSTLLGLVGDLWIRGHNVDMSNVISRQASQLTTKCVTDIPPYPWNHEKTYWHESHLCTSIRFREHPRKDLIGAPTWDTTTFEPRWRGFIRNGENPWVQDHQVQKTVIYPAAGMMAAVIEGMSQRIKGKTNVLGYEISDMTIEKAMIIPNTAHGLEFQLNIRHDPSSLASQDQLEECHEFSLYSKDENKPWDRNAFGKVCIRFKGPHDEQMYHQYATQQEMHEKSCSTSMMPRQLYELLDTMGMNYGPSFQNVVELRQDGDSCVGKVRVPNTKAKMPSKYEYPHVIHPATLDAMFHTLFAIEPTPMVPTYIKRLFVSANIVGGEEVTFSGYSTAKRVGLRDAQADIVMRQTDNEKAIVVIDGLQLTSLSSTGADDGAFLPNYKNLASELTWKKDVTLTTSSQNNLIEEIELMAHKYAGLSILQIGGGHYICDAIVKGVAQRLDAPHLSRYTIAKLEDDYTWDYASTTLNSTHFGPFLEHKAVDGSEALADYHIIIATGEVGFNPRNMAKHLQAGGILINIPGAQGNVMFDILKKPLDPLNNSRMSVTILRPEVCSKELELLMTKIQDTFTSDDSHPFVSFITPSQILENVDQLQGKIVISVLDFAGTEPGNQSIYDWGKPDFDAFHALQKYCKGIMWLTRGAVMTPVNPKGAPAIGLFRTLLSEDPTRTHITFDLDFDTKLDSPTVPQNVFQVFKSAFMTSTGPNPRDFDFAEKDGDVYIPRLDTITSLNHLIESNGNHGDLVPMLFDHDGVSDSVLELNIAKPGLQNDSMHFVKIKRQDLGPNDVEIKFERAALSPIDADTAMGQTVRTQIGNCMSGHVTRVGSEVTKFKVDDKVTALSPQGAIRNIAVADASLVQHGHYELSASALISAYHALCSTSRIRKGAKILVHAGASLYGLAAVLMAQHRGATVLSTIIGPNEQQQREVLVKNGVAEENILDPSAEDVSARICTLTSGKGVELVYNPTQELIDVSAKCVRKCGTIVQLASQSTRPASPIGITSATVVNFDLPLLISEDPEYVSELFAAVNVMYHQGLGQNISGQNVTIDYRINELEGALHYVKNSPYVGQVTVSANDNVSQVKLIQDSIKPLDQAIYPNGTYILAGGLGGLGQTIASLLVANGARNIAFLSRSGAASPSTQTYIQSLTAQGVNVEVFRTDICDAQALENLVAGSLASMPPVRGVFQCAAVLRDGMFYNMTFEDWDTAIKPKTIGSWNLVQAFSKLEYDPFFIFLASSAGIVGNRGQANYAAGNCFKDSMARMLRLQGRRAVSIDLGPVLGAGMLAHDDDLLDILKASGFYGVRYDDFLLMIHHAITQEILPGIPMPPQITLGVGTGGIMAQNNPADAYWSRTALYLYLSLMDMPPPDLELASNKLMKDMKSLLARCMTTQSATEIMTIGLTNMLAKAMNMLPEEIDAGKPPNAYGVDSLVAVGVRNWIFSNCGVSISVFEVMSDNTIAEMARMIAEKGGFGGED